MKPTLLLIFFFSTTAFLSAGVKPAEKPVLQVQTGHTAMVMSLAASPDERLLLSGSMDNTVKLWDLNTGIELKTFRGHKKWITAMSFTPDVKGFSSGEWGPEILDWSLTDSAPLRRRDHENMETTGMAFSPDGKLLVTAMKRISGAQGVMTWDTRTIYQSLTLEQGRDDGLSCAFSPDGRVFATGGKYETSVITWDAKTGKKVTTYQGLSKPVLAIAFSPDSLFLAAGSESGELCLWKRDNPTPLWSVKTATRDPESLAFSLDGNSIILSSMLETVLIVDKLSGRTLSSFNASHGGHISTAVYLPRKNHLVSVGKDQQIRVWDLGTGTQIQSMGPRSGSATSVVLSSKEPTAYTGSSTGLIHKWDLGLGRLVSTLPAYTKKIENMALSPDERYLAAGFVDGQLRVFDTVTDQEIFKAEQEYGTRFLLFSKDGKTLVAGSGTVNVWDVKTWKLKKTLDIPEVSFTSMAFSQDNKSLYLGTGGLKVIQWELSTGKILGALGEFWPAPPSNAAVSALTVSPNGKTLAAGYDNGELVLWNTDDKAMTFWSKIHDQAITGLAFKPDSKRLISSSKDALVKISTLGVEESQTLDSKRSGILGFAQSPSTPLLILVSDNGDLIAWDPDKGQEIFNMAAGSNGEWLLWTGDGYWDGSTMGGHLIAMVQGFKSWRIDQFAIRNNRPDIILGRIPGASPQAIEVYKSQFQKRLKRLGLKEADLGLSVEIPQIQIESSKVTENFIDLVFNATSREKPLAGYQIYSNGVPVFSDGGKPLAGGNSQKMTHRLELVKGQNRIEISCQDRGGAESYRIPLTAVYGGKNTQDLYFLAFGVADYQDPLIRDLRFTQKDALDLEGVFKAMEGKSFAKVHSRVLTGNQVTKEGISGTKEFLAATQAGDTVVLFISGHGVQAGDQAEYYYVTADAKLADIPGTAAPFSLIEDLLQGIPARNKLFLMDTCESGQADETTVMAQLSSGNGELQAKRIPSLSARGLSVVPPGAAAVNRERDRYIFNDLTRRTGTVVFSSSQASEASHEAPRLSQGLFTYAIIQALTTPVADKNKDKLVSSDELRSYVTSEVPRILKTLDPKAIQNPTVDRDNLEAVLAFPLK